MRMHATPSPPSPPTQQQVADTSKIAVGQFVRIYALAKSPARRRQLLAAAAPATPAQPAGRKFLPLTAALKQSLDQAAYEEGQEAGAGGVSMAAQGGTLDAVSTCSSTDGWGRVGESGCSMRACLAFRTCSQCCCPPLTLTKYAYILFHLSAVPLWGESRGLWHE